MTWTASEYGSRSTRENNRECPTLTRPTRASGVRPRRRMPDDSPTKRNGYVSAAQPRTGEHYGCLAGPRLRALTAFQSEQLVRLGRGLFRFHPPPTLRLRTKVEAKALLGVVLHGNSREPASLRPSLRSALNHLSRPLPPWPLAPTCKPTGTRHFAASSAVTPGQLRSGAMISGLSRLEPGYQQFSAVQIKIVPLPETPAAPYWKR